MENNEINKSWTFDDWITCEFDDPIVQIMVRDYVLKHIDAKYVLTFYNKTTDLECLEQWIVNNCSYEYFKYCNEEYIFKNKNDFLMCKIAWL